jgi:cysteine desulfurase family protein (TIGR01976 family)
MPYTEADCRRAREDFPALSRTLDGDPDGTPTAFLDGPAGTHVPETVIEAIARYYRTSSANTGGHFATSRESEETVLSARRAMAAFLGAPAGPDGQDREPWRTISFGWSSTTLAFALARAFRRMWGPGDEVVITALEHETNRGPWLTLEEAGVTVREVAVRPGATLDPDDLARKITGRTRLVAVGAASNAFGTVNDLDAARRLSREAGALLLVDAVHSAPHFPQDVAALDADFLLCSAYKFYGPHVGVLYSRPGLLDELPVDRLRTADQEAPERIETGTPNHAALAGVAAAVEYIAGWGEGGDLRSRVVSAMEGISAYERSVAGRYFERVREVPGVTVWGPDFSVERRAPTVSITIDGVTAAEAAKALGERGICVWDGDFYAARPVEALGLTGRGGVLRAGFVMYNTAEEADRLADAVGKL